MLNSSFDTKYRNIITPISKNLSELDDYIGGYFHKKKLSFNPIIPIVKEFLDGKGKRIRSSLIFLLFNALRKEVDEQCYKLAMVQEFLHNATLIHDDIIDCSELRRGKKTLNFEYDSKLAVLAGDYLLSEAMMIINSIQNEGVKDIYTNTLSMLIGGEINQYFNRYKIITVDEYIEKSKNKTARLFEAGLVSAYLFASCDNKETENIKNFAINFGIGFQIMNDLQNIQDKEKIGEDIQNGDYSAPIIYFVNEKYGASSQQVENSPAFIKQVWNSNAIEKTRVLAKEYFSKAIENIVFIEDNLYRQALIDMCLLYMEN